MHFKSPKPGNTEERILPLINVVFLLLIFFMLAGRLTVADPFQAMPPESVSEGQPGVRDMLIVVGEDGRVALDGEELDDEILITRVRDRMNGSVDMRVQLKGDGGVEATRIIELMEYLHDAGVERLLLLTVPASG